MRLRAKKAMPERGGIDGNKKDFVPLLTRLKSKSASYSTDIHNPGKQTTLYFAQFPSLS